MNLCFIDCETTGLDLRRHTVWEIGVIIGDYEHEWQLELTDKEQLAADAGALRIGNYYERRNPIRSVGATKSNEWSRNRLDGAVVPIRERRSFADFLAEKIGGSHLAGCAVAFDHNFIGRWLRRNGRVAAWHYHLIDVEAIVAGNMVIHPPWKSTDLSKAIGIDPDEFPRHTALGDALWAKAMYESVMGIDPAQQATQT